MQHAPQSSLQRACDALNRRVGTAMSWLTVAAVVLMFANVLLRYLFNAGAPWQVELVLALHAATFLGCMGFTLQAGEQVRVDVFYARFSLRKKAWVDLLGTCLLLFPLCAALVWFSWSFVATSWSLNEASAEYGGLQGIFLLKTFLLIGPALLAVQGLSAALGAIAVLKGDANG